MQLRPAVAPFDPAGGQVAGLPVHIVDLVQALGLPHTQVGEQPGGLGAPSRRRSGNPKVLPDADMVADAAVVEPLHPVLTHELAIRQQAVDALRAEEPDIALYQLYPLLRVGGALLRQYAEQQRVSHPVVHHGQHKDVDVGAAELPVGPVYGQTKRAFYGQQAEDDARDEVTVKVEFGEKTLDSPQTRRRFAGESKTVDKRLKHTVLALHRATINSDMSLMCAKLMFSFKKVLNVSDISLFLLP